MNTRHSTAYEALAALAAEQAGLKEKTAQAAADDDAARQIRDSLWEQYERMLRDTRTYTLKDVRDWLTDKGPNPSRSSVHRDRAALLEKERIVELAVLKANAVLDAAAESGEHDVLKASRVVAGQLLFNCLSGLSSAALEGLKPHQVLRMIDTLGLLSKAHAETDLIRQKLAELQRKLEDEKGKADKAAEKVLTDSKVSRDTINRIRAIYGLPKLEDLAA